MFPSLNRAAANRGVTNIWGFRGAFSMRHKGGAKREKNQLKSDTMDTKRDQERENGCQKLTEKDNDWPTPFTSSLLRHFDPWPPLPEICLFRPFSALCKLSGGVEHHLSIPENARNKVLLIRYPLICFKPLVLAHLRGFKHDPLFQFFVSFLLVFKEVLCLF